MSEERKNVEAKVTLLGGGPLETTLLERALALAPRLIAADGGANHITPSDYHVVQIVGDNDSLRDAVRWQAAGTELVHVAEQDSTDFEKCLRAVAAELYLGVGFLGGRIDHELACLRALAAYPDKRIVLLGREDVVFLLPEEIRLEVGEGARVSLYPMAACRGISSEGLRWPIAGLEFAPDGLIGTSNEAVADEISLRFDRAKMLGILPIGCLDAVIAALGG